MQDNEKESRADGYKNLMNKYGTQDDVSEQYRFESDDPVTDVELTLNYEENGLFAKIIDIPSDDAVSSGFEYGVNDVDLETFINDSLDELDFEGAASTAIKWSRLYGGSLMVMIIDDGKQIDEPVDWDNIRGIDELLVFERPLITTAYIITIQRPVNGRNLESLNSTMYLQCMASSFVSTKAGAYCSRMEHCHNPARGQNIVSLACQSTRGYIKPCRKLLHRMGMELSCLIGRYKQFIR